MFKRCNLVLLLGELFICVGSLLYLFVFCKATAVHVFVHFFLTGLDLIAYSINTAVLF
jgi:hypothetical protein